MEAYHCMPIFEFLSITGLSVTEFVFTISKYLHRLIFTRGYCHVK